MMINASNYKNYGFSSLENYYQYDTFVSEYLSQALHAAAPSNFDHCTFYVVDNKEVPIIDRYHVKGIHKGWYVKVVCTDDYEYWVCVDIENFWGILEDVVKFCGNHV